MKCHKMCHCVVMKLGALILLLQFYSLLFTIRHAIPNVEATDTLAEIFLLPITLIHHDKLLLRLYISPLLVALYKYGFK